MLRVFDYCKKKIGAFHDYNDFLGFITIEENQKLLGGGASLRRGYWAFAEYSPEKLKKVCALIKPGFLTTIQLIALEQKLGLLEICHGDPAVLQEVPITPEIDVEEFRKKFCLDYCRQRGWRLIETRDYKSSAKSLAGERCYVVHPHTRKIRLAQTNLDNTQGRRLKAELDCCIERLRQQPAVEKPVLTQSPKQKGEF